MAFSDESDEAFAQRLTTQYGVAAIPPSVFYHDRRDHRVLRFCFAKQDQTLTQAAERLCRI
ncbi:MAG: aminotransferase class I/II-fold pyridoxal phosphate-dependent enzyme [Desulfatitalea sp.]